SGGIHSPERLEMRKMLTGNDSLQEDSAPVDFETGTTDVAFEIGSNIETFASVNAYADWLVAQAVQRWQHVFGKPALPNFGPPDVGVITLAREMTSVAIPNEASLDGVASSSTNTQIEGVDEADFVEVDNDTLYALAHGRLSIVRGFSEMNPELLDQITVETMGQTAGMYLYGDRLTIISRQHTDMAPAESSHGRHGIWPPILGRPQTAIVILDVSDPTDVSVVNRLTIDGLLGSSRMVDGHLRLVLNHHLDAPYPEVVSKDSGHSEEVGPTSPHEKQSHRMLSLPDFHRPWLPIVDTPKAVATYETADSYSFRVRQRLLDSMTPQIYETDASGNLVDVRGLVGPTEIDVPQAGDCQQLTTVTALDISGQELQSAATTGFFTKGSVKVFATAESVYVFDGHGASSRDGIGILRWGQQATDITKVTFNFDGSGSPVVSLSAQGSFSGNILNQFAVDEQEGFLRVVVETWDEGSSVLVFDHQADSLVEIGALRGLASNENLYSVRFAGNRAYFVTFLRTDPLFVVDLSSPTDPVLLGELHVPGFSDHIQPLDENHLFTIGSDADEMTGRMGGLQVSIFDVSDSANPLLLHRYSLTDDRGSSTDITGSRWRRGDGDHLALGFFPEQGVVTVPVKTRGHVGQDRRIDLPGDLIDLPGVAFPEPFPRPFIGQPSVGFPDVMPVPRWKPPAQYLEVLSFDVESGIGSLGRIDHTAPVQRAVQIAGYLVGVSESEVSVHTFADPGTPVDSVPLDAVHIFRPLKALPDRHEPKLPAIGRLVDQSVAGIPFHGSWLVKEAEQIGDRQVLYAEHMSGTVHRMVSTKPVQEADWSAFGFASMSNLESQLLDRTARGSQDPQDLVTEQIQSMVSDAILDRFSLVRDSSGQVQRRLLFATLGGSPDTHS
ncbi:MAG TPA: hypothetical protein DCR06_03535, partial [Planctomycetaceae bacterium]|nr:hypothetical protein [Planctomycetaceae bacterium]